MPRSQTPQRMKTSRAREPEDERLSVDWPNSQAIWPVSRAGIDSSVALIPEQDVEAEPDRAIAAYRNLERSQVS